MTKVHSFDASIIMEQISKYAPVSLLVFAFLSFIAVGIFSVDYYESLFTSRFGRSARAMAILIAIIQEAVRFGLLVTSIKDFRDSKTANGTIGLIGSLCLVFHDISVTNRVAQMWSNTDPLPYSSLFLFLILIGLLLELRLILTLSKPKKSAAAKSLTNQFKKNGVSTAAKN